MPVASSFPFLATYWLNGHSFMEQELNRSRLDSHKNDNAFLAVDDVAALQATADRLNPEMIRKRLDYWTLVLGPKFSKRERSQMNRSRFYAIAQVEYCRNFIFRPHFRIHKIFERCCEIGSSAWRQTESARSSVCARPGPPAGQQAAYHNVDNEAQPPLWSAEPPDFLEFRTPLEETCTALQRDYPAKLRSYAWSFKPNWIVTAP
jgi:hypothetical protein